MPRLEHNVANCTEFPMMSLQARTVEFVTHAKSGKLEDKMSGQTIKVVATSAGRAILEIDPGLGKSRIAIECYLKLCPSARVLVKCSKKALNTWRREFPKWTTSEASDVTIIEGTPAQRRKQWATPSQVKVVTYQSGANDLKYAEAFDPTMTIDDECKIMRNRKTQMFKKWQKFNKTVKYYIPMDGTLVTKGPQDLWTFLHMCKPKLYSSYWKFVQTFCIVVDGPFGKEVVGAQNIKNLAAALSKLMVRIKDTDPGIKEQRPPLTRDFKLVEMTQEQSKLYRELAEDLIAVTPSGEVLATPSMLSLQVRHRQILICPKILDPQMGYGGAIDHLLDNLEDDPHAVIFTPFKKAFPFLRQAIIDRGHPPPYMLSGGAASEEVGRVEKEFNSSAGSQRACLCTVAFAESFELWSAKQGHFIGYEWRQDLNYQAEKRLHRLITPHPINIWYYRYRNTVDDLILDRLNTKQGNVRLTYQDYVTAVRRLKNVT